MFSSTCTDAARAVQVKQAEREYQQLGRRVLAHHPCATRWRQRYTQLRPSSALHALPRPESDRQAYAGSARSSGGLASKHRARKEKLFGDFALTIVVTGSAVHCRFVRGDFAHGVAHNYVAMSSIPCSACVWRCCIECAQRRAPGTQSARRTPVPVRGTQSARRPRGRRRPAAAFGALAPGMLSIAATTHAAQGSGDHGR